MRGFRDSSSVRVQFVLDVDKVLFSAFCPQKLKEMLDVAGELDIPPTPRYNSLDSGVVLKLTAAFAMIAIMVGTTILPQLGVLQEAAEALCGISREAPVYRRARAVLTVALWMPTTTYAGRVGL